MINQPLWAFSVNEEKNVTEILSCIRAGQEHLTEELFEEVQAELRRIAASYMKRERPGHLLQPTVLVNDAFQRLVGQKTEVEWTDRKHFYRAAARAMRRILIDYARKQKNEFQFDDSMDLLGTSEVSESLLRLNDALDALSLVEPTYSEIVVMKFFGGYTHKEIGEIQNCSERTVKKRWAAARAWLLQELSDVERKD